MEVKNNNRKGFAHVIDTPPSAKKKVSAVAVKLREKRLFQDKVEAARKTLTGLKSLPI